MSKIDKTIQIPVVGSSKEGEMSVIPTGIFGQEVNDSVLTQYVQSYLNNQRQGTACAKDRSQVAGTTKKMYKQKGTGNARHGSAKAPIFKGGGVVGGPKPKNYEDKMNKKQKVIAFISALSQASLENRVYVLAEDVTKMNEKTAQIAKVFTAIQENKKLTFVVAPVLDKLLARVAKNIPSVSLVHVQELNPFLILTNPKIVFSHEALKEIVKRFA